MNRRKFITVAGLATAGLMMQNSSLFSQTANRAAIADITLTAYQERIARARELMRAAKIDLLFTIPSKNLAYLAKLNTWRSERLMALLLPLEGEPTFISPAFEEERVRRTSVINRIATWQESENPYLLAADLFRSMNATRVGMEASTDLGTYWKLRAAAPKLDFVDAGEIFTALRIQKSAAEIGAIRRATALTLESIAAAQAALAADKTELDILAVFSRDMEKRGAPGDGIVQFGPGSALPHGGPGERKLTRGMPVLIDVGCQIDGYFSDISRTIYWGENNSAKFKEIYNIVWQAQQAGMETARAGVECQAVDRAARAVIEKAGYGKYFTHRLGHGMGLDGHEPPYLVEGNTFKLQPGNVVTIEPGIYLPDEFGVRIEDDFLITEQGAEPLSKRVAMI